MTPTMTTIAEECGVSQSTVSLVYNGVAGRVSMNTRDRVLEALTAHGYAANPMARGLRGGRTYTLLLYARDLGTPYQHEMTLTIQIAAAARGYTVTAIDQALEDRISPAAFRSLLKRKVDGVLFSTMLGINKREEWGLNDTPAVIKGDPEHVNGCDIVSDDEFTGTYAAVKHLVGLGHRRIGFATGDLQRWYNRRAFAAFQVALGEGKIALDSTRDLFEWEGAQGNRVETGEAVFEAFIQRGPPPTAIVAASDYVAAGIIRKARGHDMRIPRDLSVIGKGNYPFADCLDPPLASLATDQVVGELMVATLLDRIEGRLTGPPRVLTMPQRLVLRGSTTPPRSGTPGRPASLQIGDATKSIGQGGSRQA